MTALTNPISKLLVALAVFVGGWCLPADTGNPFGPATAQAFDKGKKKEGKKKKKKKKKKSKGKKKKAEAANIAQAS